MLLFFGLKQKATEEQNAEDQCEGYNDYLDETHDKFLRADATRAWSNQMLTAFILDSAM
jgi:hypothetical protein